jgi:hypothetical protein
MWDATSGNDEQSTPESRVVGTTGMFGAAGGDAPVEATVGRSPTVVLGAAAAVWAPRRIVGRITPPTSIWSCNERTRFRTIQSSSSWIGFPRILRIFLDKRGRVEYVRNSEGSGHRRSRVGKGLK